MKLALAKRGKVYLNDVGFYKDVRDGWEKSGVYTASVEILKR